ncbi:MAG: alpha/beta hydrolase [Dehalococcoidia bacterium]|nr:alpha/beta hydrolase [Dehalococcoidia bacterium]MCB9485903.1 alpha/beta hydrolase [Thermoflexaceae bacterium]
MRWIDVNGHDIAYREEGTGQPLVFLHGMSSCGEAWWQQFDAFSKDYRVVAYDSINHGHSANSPRGEMEPDRTDELEGFLTALGIERPILAGNSMGGATILRWAARRPGEARALVVSGMGIAEPGKTSFREIQPLDQETLFLPIGDSLTDTLRRERPLMYERYLRIRSTATRLEYMRHPRQRNPLTVSETESLNARIGDVKSPMLVIVGSLDGLVPNAKRLHGKVGHSHYHEVAGAPHNVYWEAAEEWNRVVAGFLAGTS